MLINSDAVSISLQLHLRCTLRNDSFSYISVFIMCSLSFMSKYFKKLLLPTDTLQPGIYLRLLEQPYHAFIFLFSILPISILCFSPIFFVQFYTCSIAFIQYDKYFFVKLNLFFKIILTTLISYLKNHYKFTNLY